MPDDLPSVAQLNEDVARGLKQDGHGRAEVLRKLIQVHHLPEAEAAALVAKVFGLRGKPQASTGGARIATGLALAGAGVAGGALVYFSFGLTPLSLTVPSYLLAFGAATSGLIAIVKAVVGEE